ncbi:hypothetical protein [Staphylococcus arlettae]|uniref:hypothetical protein n=1 Tax=Staphylococcus arlettae TaxID=29378 RepID=UPI003EDEB014
MKKKIISIIGASCILAGCGSQNLAPLEEKSTDLREKNHNLKLDIQELNQSITDQKARIADLKQDKANMKKAKSNEKRVNYMKASSKYYDNIANVISDYNSLEPDLTKNKADQKIQSKLDKLISNTDKAYATYEGKVDTDDMSSDAKSKHKNIKTLNKDLSKALAKIKEGYSAKDKKKLKAGQQDLTEVSINEQ